ncbi:MAG: PHP domain-containing protein [Bacillota bacterium]
MSMLDFNLVMDLHNHTIWSDGADKPENKILNAINHRVEAVGITDHFCNDDKYSLGFDKLKIYLNKIDRLRTKYINSIKVFIGIEMPHTPFGRHGKLVLY